MDLNSFIKNVRELPPVAASDERRFELPLNIFEDVVKTNIFDRIEVVSDAENVRIARAYRNKTSTVYVLVIRIKPQTTGAPRRSGGRAGRSLSKEQAAMTKLEERDPFLKWLDDAVEHTVTAEKPSPGEEPMVHDVSAPAPTPYDPAAIAKALGASSVSK